jgi:hypothetical protein
VRELENRIRPEVTRRNFPKQTILVDIQGLYKEGVLTTHAANQTTILQPQTENPTKKKA